MINPLGELGINFNSHNPKWYLELKLIRKTLEGASCRESFAAGAVASKSFSSGLAEGGQSSWGTSHESPVGKGISTGEQEVGVGTKDSSEMAISRFWNFTRLVSGLSVALLTGGTGLVGNVAATASASFMGIVSAWSPAKMGIDCPAWI